MAVMAGIRKMIQTHPHRPKAEVDALSACIEACGECASTCQICADACLHEDDPKSLAFCIRTDLDCADVCAATGGILSRASRPDAKLVRTVLEACASACRSCGAECQRHAEMHAHCRICAEVCLTCDKACRRLLQVTPA
jgi:hypothetical protein